ncbi:hypothetical protein PR048_015680 [Dryococelus australis]|uniref:Ig-like domain-containing protein n=1 Tax=Dryococelus australis TaxID=614101 RepID=A0ABQ9HHY1_9NEOP|nr:hypothetical protein PR048_015680 [Dryococelus australis]
MVCDGGAARGNKNPPRPGVQVPLCGRVPTAIASSSLRSKREGRLRGALRRFSYVSLLSSSRKWLQAPCVALPCRSAARPNKVRGKRSEDKSDPFSLPPDIVDEETSSDVTVKEGENATLVCRATGHPHPRIIWKREDGTPLVLKKNIRDFTRAVAGKVASSAGRYPAECSYTGDAYANDSVETFSGDELSLMKLDRKQMGAYMCIASNDVPPAVSKRIVLSIHFPPKVTVPNQLLGAPLGTDVHIDCYVEAYPNTINYWVKNRGEMLLNGLNPAYDLSVPPRDWSAAITRQLGDWLVGAQTMY